MFQLLLTKAKNIARLVQNFLGNIEIATPALGVSIHILFGNGGTPDRGFCKKYKRRHHRIGRSIIKELLHNISPILKS